MKNVALMIYSLKGGGAERVVSLLSKGLSQKYNVYIFLFDTDDITYSYEGQMIDFNIKSKKNPLQKIFNFVRRAYLVRKKKKELGIEITVSFLEAANIVNLVSRVNDKIIISVRSNLSARNIGRKNYFKPILKLLYKKADKIVSISNGVRNDLVNNFKINKKNIDTIYNPIDIESVKKKACEVNLELDFSKEQFTISTSGRLNKAKGQWHLIRAISYVQKEISNIRLLILGKGELERDLKTLVKDLGLEENVIFLGFKENPFKYISKSDLFVFTSLYEGFGNVIIEAMACGVPVISTDCSSGPREILSPNTNEDFKTNQIEHAMYGVLVPVLDGKFHKSNEVLIDKEITLAKAIIEMYHNKDIRKKYIVEGEKRIERFKLEYVSEEWERMIDGI